MRRALGGEGRGEALGEDARQTTTISHRSISAPVRAILELSLGAVAVRLYNHSLCSRTAAGPVNFLQGHRFALVQLMIETRFA
jgi:hypothetical protein